MAEPNVDVSTGNDAANGGFPSRPKVPRLPINGMKTSGAAEPHSVKEARSFQEGGGKQNVPPERKDSKKMKGPVKITFARGGADPKAKAETAGPKAAAQHRKSAVALNRQPSNLAKESTGPSRKSTSAAERHRGDDEGGAKKSTVGGSVNASLEQTQSKASQGGKSKPKTVSGGDGQRGFDGPSVASEDKKKEPKGGVPQIGKQKSKEKKSRRKADKKGDYQFLLQQSEKKIEAEQRARSLEAENSSLQAKVDLLERVREELKAAKDSLRVDLDIEKQKVSQMRKKLRLKLERRLDEIRGGSSEGGTCFVGESTPGMPGSTSVGPSLCAQADAATNVSDDSTTRDFPVSPSCGPNRLFFGNCGGGSLRIQDFEDVFDDGAPEEVDDSDETIESNESETDSSSVEETESDSSTRSVTDGVVGSLPQTGSREDDGFPKTLFVVHHQYVPPPASAPPPKTTPIVSFLPPSPFTSPVLEINGERIAALDKAVGASGAELLSRCQSVALSPPWAMGSSLRRSMGHSLVSQRQVQLQSIGQRPVHRSSLMVQRSTKM